MVEAAREITNENIFQCDVGRFNEDVFVYVAAFGLFTEVSYSTDQQMKNALGHMAYILEGIKSLSSIKSYKLHIEGENVVQDGEYGGSLGCSWYYHVDCKTSGSIFTIKAVKM